MHSNPQRIENISTRELNYMRLLKESEVREKEYFMSSISFLDAEVEVPKEFAYENIMVKGSKFTGKTSKVLIPLYKQFKHGKLYITVSDSYSDRILEDDTMVIDIRDKKNPTTKKIVDSLIAGKAIYLNIDMTNHEEKSSELVNKIFHNLLDRKKELTTPVLIACDDLNFMMRIDSLLEYLKSSATGRKEDINKNFYLASTLCYTRQLVGLYTEEEVEEIKKYVTMVDVEKQPLIYKY
jgi:hypothetical protein